MWPCIFVVLEELFFLSCGRFVILGLALVLTHIQEFVLQISPLLGDDA